MTEELNPYTILRSELFKDGPQCFTEESVTEWLLGPQKNSSRQALIKAEMEGPGEVQGWKLLSGESACFASTQWQMKNPKKKIILSLAFLNVMTLRPNELQLLSALIEYFDVYLWQGKEINIATAKPLANIHDFLSLCSTMQAANTKNIQNYLEKNHLPVDQYLILDLQSYTERWDIAFCLDTAIWDKPSKIQVFIDSVDAATFHTLKLRGEFSPHLLQMLIRHLPNLHSLNLKFLSCKKFLETLACCEGSHIKKITLINPDIGSEKFFDLYLPKNYGIERLIIDGRSTIIQASADEEIELVLYTLKLPKITGKIKLCQENPLEDDNPWRDITMTTLHINSLAEYEKLRSLPQSKTLTSLVVNINSQDFPHLKFATDFPRLKYLVLSIRTTDVREDPHMELGSLASLEYLYIAPFSPTIKLQPQPNLLQLNIYDSDLDLSLFPKLIFLTNRTQSDIQQLISRDPKTPAEPKLEKKRRPTFKSKAKLPAPTPSSHCLSPQGRRHLEEKNATRDFSFFSFQDELFPQQPTDKPLLLDLRDKPVPGRIRYSLREGGPDADPVGISDYLGQAYNRIKWHRDGRLSFSKAIPVDGYKDISSSIQLLDHRTQPIAAGMHSGSGEGILVPGVFYPLAQSAPSQDLTLYAAASPKLELHQDSRNGHYYVRLPLGNPPIKVNFFYEFTPQENYTATPDFEWALEENLLSPELQQEVSRQLQKIPELKFLLDPRITLREKINRLISFFKSFINDTRLAGSHPPKSLALLLASIKAKCGNCEELSEGFLLLAQWLGIDAQLRPNGQHAFIQLRNQEGDLIHINLGGGINVDYIYPTVGGPAKSPRTPTALPPAKNIYEDLIREQLDKPVVFSWRGTMPDIKSAKPLLIRLAKTESIAELRQFYFSPKDIPGEYLFINRPADFNYYSQGYAVKNGRRVPVASPLETLLEGGGFLFINLSNIPLEQQEIYQSLWANPPHWKHKPLHKNTRIIGFLAEDLPCSNSFTRNSLPVVLPPRPEPAKRSISPKPIVDSTSTAIVVDLFKDSDWYEQLIANLTFKDRGQADFSEGPLLRAIPLKQPLIIHQPPDDPEFEHSLEQIREDGRFYFNGAWQTVPEEVRISLDQNPLTTAPSTPPFKVLIEDKDSKSAQRHYIHLNNWHSLYKQILADEKGYPVTVAGHLAAKEPPIFYITEAIPPWKWQRLALFLLKQTPKREYTFQLAPGITAEINYFPQQQPDLAMEKTLAVNDLATELATSHSCCFLSNDTNYLAEKIQDLCPEAQEPLIIDLTPESSATELLYSVRAEKLDTADPQLVIKKHLLLQALEQGKTVILRGEISNRLLQELLPVFDPKPYVECNGQRLPITGRLILIQPSSSAKKIPLNCPQRRCEFSLEDYRRELLATSKSDQKERAPSRHPTKEEQIVDKLLLLFKMAPWPHRGSTMPEEMGLCFTRLRNMKQKLLERPASGHRHNPIKGLLLGDYLPDSEEYAYLNVLCKILFDESDQDPMRLEKYQRLRSSFPAAAGSEFVWRALNTCNGATLKALLSPQWLTELANKPLPPEGLIAHWKATWPDVFKILDEVAAEHSKPAPQPTTTTASLSGLWSYFFSAPSKVKPAELKTLPPTPVRSIASRQLKTKRRLDDLLLSPTSPRVIIAKGEPGVGKSHFLNSLAEDDRFHCSQSFEDSSAAHRDATKPHLHLADEANTARPGMLSAWDAVHRNSTALIDRGQIYSSPSKFFVTANPEYFAGRFYQESMQRGETVWLQMPSVAELEQELIDYYKISPKLASQLIATAELYKTHQPSFGYSYRELHSLMQLFQVLEKRQATRSATDILREKYGHLVEQLSPSERQALLAKILEQQIADRCYDAACGTFAGCLPEIAAQQKFKQQLCKQLKLPALPLPKNKQMIVGGKVFPPEMHDAHKGLQHALWIRDHVLAQHREAKDQRGPAHLTYKRGFLLQGALGIGKNELIQGSLKDAGLTPGSIGSFDARHNYLEVNAAEENFEEIATLAFKHRMILLVKDLHLLPPKKERFYGDLLMGIVDGRTDEVPGFMILSDGNYGGSLSPALCSRMSICHIPVFADSSWQLLAQQRLAKPQAQAFTQGFWHPKTPHPRKVSGHDFFGCLDKVPTATPSI